MTVPGTHDSALVALSVLVAMFASYTALDLAGRVRASSGGPHYAWLAASAVTMGGGIWAMHFVAMLAFSMPKMPVHYHPGLTLLSLALAILVTGAGFFLVSRDGSRPTTVALSGLLMGLGIIAMHYTGMAAMHMPADLSYDRVWVTVSVMIAIGAATSALWVAFRNTGLVQKAAASLVMGIAIAGMHYTAMQGATFSAYAMLDDAHGSASFDQTALALAVAAVTFLILFLALVAAMFDRRFALLAEREAEALRRSEERFRGLYNKTPLPLHALSQDGIIEHVSDAWLELLGYSRPEVIGRPITDFMTADSVRHREEDVWPKLMQEGSLKEVEYRLVTKSGQVLDVLMSGRVERDAEGRYLYALGGIVDVTARKQAEVALRQAQKMEAVGQLTGGMAHDFNNLLAVVLGNLELLRKRLPDDPKLLRLLDSAAEGAKRGAALTQRLLAFARRQDLKTGPVDLQDLVRGMTDLLQRSVGPLVRIETHFRLGLRCALVDANQAELALLNLAVNARDAMPDGGTITIAAREETTGPGHASGLPPGEYVCLSVSDTGQGMNEAVLARAAEPFYTTKGVGKGTGLGLSMVHGLAAQSGGRLVLRSRPGEGTTAEIWLPAAEPTVAKALELPAVEPASTTSSVKPLRVLVVDDDALVLGNIAAMLEDLGHQVLVANSGPAALEEIEKGPVVDLVITDHAMPGMTGADLAREIALRWPDLPVILATGYADPKSPPAADLPRLTKPFRQGQLSEAIRERIAVASENKVLPFRARHGL